MKANRTQLLKIAATKCFIILFVMNFQCSNPQKTSGDETSYEKVENAEHVVVYYEKDKFLGWPANNGAWSADGVNMLVGFTHGDYELIEGNHNIGGNQVSWLARSTDMGKTWEGYDPVDYVGDFGKKPELLTLETPIDFSHPQFAMRMVGTSYHGTHDDRGHFFFSY